MKKGITIKYHIHFLITLISVLSTHYTFAQYTEVINSNRPGESQSAYALGPRVYQIEFGGFTIDETHQLMDYQAKGFGIDFNARGGFLFEELEFILEGTYKADTFTTTNLSYLRGGIDSEIDRSNFSNLSFGAKYLLLDPYKNAHKEKPNLYSWKANNSFKWKSILPAIAIYAAGNYDTANNAFNGPNIEGFSPKAGIITQNNFYGGWVFVTNFLMDRIGTESSEFQYIITLTKSIGKRWAIFGENQGVNGSFYSDNLIRGGAGYLITKNFQLDTSVTFNSKDTPKVLNLAFGISYRLDRHRDKQIKGSQENTPLENYQNQ